MSPFLRLLSGRSARVAQLGLLALGAAVSAFAQADSGRPALRKQGTATQLVADGKPFLILGGELFNSSSSSLAYMEPIWKKAQDLNMNTLLAGLNWELVEPTEGHFDFALVDGLIQGARRNKLHLVFLWFGSWKNGMSSYIPLWVKKDPKRFPRVVLKSGEKREVLTPLAESNWKADAAAFAALMRHIREFDSKDHTVLMMQVENEVGVLNDSRDHSPLAERAFSAPVPKEVLDYLLKSKAQLEPEIRKRWEDAGSKAAGNWEAVFGPGPQTNELFMAWHYARYVDQVTVAGKAAYDIPMYANVWLAEADRPEGSFPSGGPLPYDLDMWRVGAAHVDMFAPDLYAPTFAAWCARYTRNGNPLFIPETMGFGDGPRNVFYAFGEHDAIGTSPFGMDMLGAIPAGAAAPGATTDEPWFPRPAPPDIGTSYGLLAQTAPLLLSHQGRRETAGFVLNKANPKVIRELGAYELEISLDSIFGHTADSGYGLVIATGPDEFMGAGAGFRVAFKPKTAGPARVGIGSVDEGVFKDGQWIPGRRLNGDEDDQGGAWRFDSRAAKVERCVVYRWE